MKRIKAEDLVKEYEMSAVMTGLMGGKAQFKKTPKLVKGAKELDALTTEELEIRCMNALSAARAFVSNRAPYLTDTLFALIPIMYHGLGTIAVTKHYVLVLDPVAFLLEGYLEPQVPDPQLTANLATPALKEVMQADAQRGAALMHEIGHVVRGLDRIDALKKSAAGSLVPDTRKDHVANQAFDIPIDDDLVSTNPPWQLTDICLFAASYGFPTGLTGEQYYELLAKKKPPEKGSGGSAGRGMCGTCAGNSGDSEQKQAMDKLDAKHGRTELECEIIQMNTADKIRGAASQRGNVPGGLIDSLPPERGPSIVPWQQELRAISRNVIGQIISGQSDYSLRRPSKRSVSRGIIRPGLISRQPVIILIEDSSGSMGHEQLKAGRSEMIGIMQKCGITECWFMDVDAAVAAPPKRVRITDLMSLPVHGRGGTDFRPAFEAIKKLNPRPSIAVYTTDGDGIAPAEEPKDVKTIWCVVPSAYARKPAKWGKLIIMSNDPNIREAYDLNAD